MTRGFLKGIGAGIALAVLALLFVGWTSSPDVMTDPVGYAQIGGVAGFYRSLALPAIGVILLCGVIGAAAQGFLDWWRKPPENQLNSQQRQFSR